MPDDAPAPSTAVQAVAEDMNNVIASQVDMSNDPVSHMQEGVAPDVTSRVAQDMADTHMMQFGESAEDAINNVMDGLMGPEQLGPDGFIQEGIIEGPEQQSQPLDQLDVAPSDLSDPFEGDPTQMFPDPDQPQQQGPEPQQAQEPEPDPIVEQLQLTQEHISAVNKDPNLQAVARHMQAAVQERQNIVSEVQQQMSELQAATKQYSDLQQSLATPEGVQHLIQQVLAKPMGPNTVAAAVEAVLTRDGKPTDEAPEFLLNVALAFPDLWEQTSDRFEELQGDEDKLSMWNERQRIAAERRHVQMQLSSLHEQNSSQGMARLESRVRQEARDAGLWEGWIDTTIESLPQFASSYTNPRTGEVNVPPEAIKQMVADAASFQQALQARYEQDAAQQASQDATKRTQRLAANARNRTRQAPPRPSTSVRRDLNNRNANNGIRRPVPYDDLINEALQQGEIARRL